MIDTFLEMFLQADKIIDAQFYYTNPLLYVIIDKIDGDATVKHGSLYDNYYLLNTESWHDIDAKYPVFAVNETFREQVAWTSEKTPNFFQAENLLQLHHACGLYVIGILDENLQQADA